MALDKLEKSVPQPAPVSLYSVVEVCSGSHRHRCCSGCPRSASVISTEYLSLQTCLEEASVWCETTGSTIVFDGVSLLRSSVVLDPLLFSQLLCTSEYAVLSVLVLLSRAGNMLTHATSVPNATVLLAMETCDIEKQRYNCSSERPCRPCAQCSIKLRNTHHCGCRSGNCQLCPDGQRCNSPPPLQKKEKTKKEKK